MSEKYIDGGYILLSRKLIESAIWEKPPMYLKVWIYILSKAQHKAYKNLDRGELLITIPELIEVCSHKVGYRTERPSKSQIFNILEWLRNSGEGADEDDASRNMIDTTKTTRGMIVKVHNYNVYQDPSNYERNAERNNEEVTTETMRQRQADTINKNGKNEKKEKPLSELPFERIVDYLNRKTKKNYKHTTTKTRDLIRARFNEGFEADDFKKVIDIKTAEWLNTADEKYLRPETLFGNKFESYLNQDPKALNKQRANEFTKKTIEPVYKSNSIDASEYLKEIGYGGR